MRIIILLLTISVLSLDLSAQWGELEWDTITFEQPYEYLEIDKSVHNIWQIGEPEKVFFDSAFSNSKAIITDTENSYPINNYSFFDLYIGDFNVDWYPEDIFIEIKHKFETDTMKDGGYITVSWDNGESWMNIISDSVYPGPGNPAWKNENLYSSTDTLFNGTSGFSGKSSGWVSTWFAWHQIPSSLKSNNLIMESDTMILRFNFISDEIDTDKEGWVIDDIRLYSVDLGGAVSHTQITDKFSIYPNPSTGISTIPVEEDYQAVIIKVIDLLGKNMNLEYFKTNEPIILDSKNYKPGLYIVHLTVDNKYNGVQTWRVK